MDSKFNIKRWLIASFAVLVVQSVFGFLVSRFVYPHATNPLEATLTVADPILSCVFIYFSRLIFGGAFTLVFVKLYQSRVSVKEGIQFGILMGILLDVPVFLRDMVRTDWDPAVLAMLCVVGMVEAVVLGILLSLLYGASERRYYREEQTSPLST